MKKIVFLIVFLVVASTVAVTGYASEDEGCLLSLGLQNLADGYTVRVSAMAGEDVLIAEDDFLRALNKADIHEIKILSLPEVSKGELLLCGEAVKEGACIGGNDISKLSFSPAGSYITDARFVFEDSLTGCEYTCKMFLLPEKNSAPVTRIESAGSYLTTYKDVSAFSLLPGYDPDGNAVEYIVVDYPENGAVVLDSSCGSYEYIPSEGFMGNDSFKYVVCDEYGAFSISREIKISVNTLGEDEMFSDMSDSKALAEAISLSRDGIIGGSLVGSDLMFKPDASVSRVEFIAMLMRACSVEAKENVLRTRFYDDCDIPSCFKGFVAAADELGYLEEILQDGKPYLYPNEAISRAECAIIIDRILSIENSGALQVIADIEDCPTDAVDAVNLLCTACILPMNEYSVNASSPLTREYAAKLLFNVKSFVTFGSGY